MFNYTEEEKQRLLAPLVLRSGITGRMVVSDLETACDHAHYKSDDIKNAVRDNDIIKELRILAATDSNIRDLVKELSEPAWRCFEIEAVTLWPLLLKNPPPLPKHDGVINSDYFNHSLKKAILAADHDVLRGTAKAAIATLKERKQNPTPWTGVYCGTRSVRRGQPIDFPAYIFAEAAYRTFFHATRNIPTRRVDALSGKSYGPFHEFFEAAIRPTGLIRSHVAVDNLVRDVNDYFKVFSSDALKGINTEISAVMESDLSIPPPD